MERTIYSRTIWGSYKCGGICNLYNTTSLFPSTYMAGMSYTQDPFCLVSLPVLQKRIS